MSYEKVVVKEGDFCMKVYGKWLVFAHQNGNRWIAASFMTKKEATESIGSESNLWKACPDIRFTVEKNTREYR